MLTVYKTNTNNCRAAFDCMAASIQRQMIRIFARYLSKTTTSLKFKGMKKVALFCLVVLVALFIFSSCSPSRRGTGCPMTDNIIH
jgi:hypothetical protein